MRTYWKTRRIRRIDTEDAARKVEALETHNAYLIRRLRDAEGRVKAAEMSDGMWEARQKATFADLQRIADRHARVSDLLEEKERDWRDHNRSLEERLVQLHERLDHSVTDEEHSREVSRLNEQILTLRVALTDANSSPSNRMVTW